MLKSSLIPVAIAALLVGFAQSAPAGFAQSCTANCGSRQIQFTPGQPIRLEMVNRTSSLIQIEQVFGTEPVALLPGQEIQLDSNFGPEPNASVVFWDETALAVRAVLFRPDTETLRVELYPGSASAGDRSIYVQSDGRVAIY